MERFISVECFRKKGSTFRGNPSFSLCPEFPEISVPFVHNYKCQRKYTVSFVSQLEQPAFLANDTAHSHFLCLSTERAVPFVETFSPKISFKW